MDTNFDDIFNANSPSENEAVTETPVETTQEAVTPEVTEQPAEETPETVTEEPQEQARDEKGRFVKQERNHIPVEALLEERTKRQEAERLLAEERQRIEQFAQQQKQSQRPDPFDNPDDYDAYVQAQIDARVAAVMQQQEQQKALQSFHASHQKAAEEYGQEAVQEALNWAQERANSDELWGRHALAQPDPVKWLVEQKTLHAQFEEFARDPEGFKAKLLAEQSAAAVAQAPAQNKTTMAAKVQAPKSLASQGTGTAARPTEQTVTDSFNAIFDKK